jgi:hypothetical protein
MPATTKRKVDLRVAHSRNCLAYDRSALASVKACNCDPSYYTLHRDPNGRSIKGTRHPSREYVERRRKALERRLLKLLMDDVAERNPVAVGTLGKANEHLRKCQQQLSRSTSALPKRSRDEANRALAASYRVEDALKQALALA